MADWLVACGITTVAIQPEDYSLIWNSDEGGKWGWTVEATGDDAMLGETSQEILASLEAQGACKPTSIATALRRSFGSRMAGSTPTPRAREGR
jgi:hypothetical protein